MILDIVSFRNKKMKCYANPFFIQEKLDNQEVNMMRTLQQDPAMKFKYKNLVLYHFGTFDDCSGKYDLLNEPELIFDCDDLIAQLPEEDVKNG